MVWWWGEFGCLLGGGYDSAMWGISESGDWVVVGGGLCEMKEVGRKGWLVEGIRQVSIGVVG